MATYADTLKANQESRNFRLPEGDYKVKFLECTFGKSQKQAPMFSLQCKIIGYEDAKIMEVIRDKKTRVRDYFPDMPELPWNPFENILDMINAAGGDLTKASADDENYSGIKAILNDLDEESPIFKVNLTNQKKGDRHNVRYGAWTEEDEAKLPAKTAASTEEKAPEKSEAPQKEAPVKDETPRSEEGHSYEDMLAFDWSDEDMLANEAYAFLVPKKAPAKKAPAKTGPEKAAPVKKEEPVKEEAAPVEEEAPKDEPSDVEKPKSKRPFN